jgi:hypothetical protein
LFLPKPGFLASAPFARYKDRPGRLRVRPEI